MSPSQGKACPGRSNHGHKGSLQHLTGKWTEPMEVIIPKVRRFKLRREA